MSANMTHGALAALLGAIARARKARGDTAGAQRARQRQYGARVAGAYSARPADPRSEAHERWRTRVLNMKAPS